MSYLFTQGYGALNAVDPGKALQVVKGVIHQSSDHSEFWKILAIKATDKGTRELSVQFLGDNFWVKG